jgi:putative FmdB family regulatory protein
MPLYEYECKSCQKVFEAQYKIAERDTPTKTPCECGGEIVQRITGFSIGDAMRLGVRKRPEWFTDRLKEIKKKHPRGKLSV